MSLEARLTSDANVHGQLITSSTCSLGSMATSQQYGDCWCIRQFKQTRWTVDVSEMCSAYGYAGLRGAWFTPRTARRFLRCFPAVRTHALWHLSTD